MTTLFSDTTRGATVSPDGLYRYNLWRRWGEGPALGWIMLNPSTADADLDDASIRKISHFAARDGFSAIVVRNLYAYRTPKPAVLKQAWRDGADVVGPENDSWLRMFVADRGIPHTVLAWGTGAAMVGKKEHPVEIHSRIAAVHDLFADAAPDRLWRLVPHEARGIYCYTPHPVLLDNDTPFASWRP